MLVSGSAAGPGNASNPLRGMAGNRQQPGRVVLSVSGR
jgi:hypothetical protein